MEGIPNQLIEMTPIQQAYWVGRNSGLELDGVSTHTCEEIECTNVDIERLERCFNQLILRHDMLRGRITPSGQIEILQKVPYYKFSVDDLRGRSAIEQHNRLEHLRKRMYQEVLAADAWPLYRIKAVQTSDLRHYLIISTDALMLDASSRAVLFREWKELYQGQVDELPEIGASFAEFVHEVKTDPERIARKETAREYWSARVPDLPGPPRLEARKTAPTRDQFGRVEADLTPEVFQRIVDRCEELPDKVSLTSYFLAGFSRVLARWSKSDRFHVVLTLFDQAAQQAKYASTLGDFTNTMVMDCSNDPQSSFAKLASKTQSGLRESLRHSAHDGVEVLREINLRKKEIKNPWPEDGVATVFTSVLSSRHDNEWRSAWIGKLVNMQTQTPQVGLDSQIWKVKGTVRITWDYAKSIIDTVILEDMFRDYIRELEEGTRPETRERDRGRADGDATILRSERVMTDGIAWQVKNRSDSIAIHCANKSLTFGQLGERAMAVAQAIRAAVPDGRDPVVLSVERSMDQVVGALGIMLSGRPYVPVNASWPKERVQRIADLCNAKSIVCHQDAHLEGSLGLLDRIDPSEVGTAEFDPERWPNHPDELAYIIFTSGSTGDPKGVAMQHGATMTTIDEIESRYMIDADDCVMAISAMSFDLSVWDIFGALGAGARMVIPDESESQDPGSWVRLSRKHHVTVWNSVPTLAQLMIERNEEMGEEDPLPLRLYLLSGDWIPPTLPDRLRAAGLRSLVVSLGGATEAAIWSVCYEIGLVPSSWRSIPYGRALRNQTIDVRNDALELLDVGEVGEIVIGGAGLAEAYYMDESLTRSKFTNDAAGKRVYRTGDLGRLLPDGNIEFLGRSDDQVKIAGHRIELGEVEFAMSRHEDVEACLAKAVGPPCGERKLFAYVVPAPGRFDSIDLDAVRREAARTAPEYMVPATIRLIRELPLSANGKVDRNADLEAMSSEWGDDHTTISGSVAAPAPKREVVSQEAATGNNASAVMDIVKEVLALETIAPDENLLEQGASSVDMIRIANRVEQLNGGVRPRLDDIYEEPTCAGIAALISADQDPGVPAASNVANPEEPATGEHVGGMLSVPGANKNPILSKELRTREEVQEFKSAHHGRRNDLDEVEGIHLNDMVPLVGGTRPRRRKTRRLYSQRAVTMDEMSTLIGSLRADGSPERRFNFGSSGPTYSIATYVVIKADRVAGIPAGSYWYDPDVNRLVPVGGIGEFGPEAVWGDINKNMLRSAAFGVALVYRPAAIWPVYDRASDRYAILEAGFMSQLLEMQAEEMGMGVCQVGAMDSEQFMKAADLPEGDVVVNWVVGGVRLESGDDSGFGSPVVEEII